MQFVNRIQAETQSKLETYLHELFEDTFQDQETHHFYVRYGSTVLEISNEPYGPEESTVTIMSYCVQGVELEEQLLQVLLKINHEIPFGCFSMVDNNVFFSYSLFGRTLSRSNLITAISAVATHADDYDDEIVARYGGRTALDLIQETGGWRQRVAGGSTEESGDLEG